MFGKGKIEIALQRSSFAPGDTISGNVILKMKKPVTARNLSISLIGEHKTRRVSGGMMGNRNHRSTSTHTMRIYDFKHELDGEKEYSEGREYAFEIKVPEDILSAKPGMPQAGGMLGQGLKIAQSAAAMTGAIPFQQTRWYLLAKLDIPRGLDVRKRADVIIG